MKNDTKENLVVVGVGASAGGLQAFKHFVRALPKNSGMAYVLIQHLEPDHRSSLPDILRKECKVPVREVTDAAVMVPDTVYTIPAGKKLTVSHGRFILEKRGDAKVNRLIDTFFDSLAKSYADNAVGILLSGSGDDGTRGLKAINEHGGLCMVHNPKTAEYADMPENALASEIVDLVMAPGDMAMRLTEIYGKHGERTTLEHEGTVTNSGEADKDIGLVLSELHRQKGIDFSHYKRRTVERRISRRMAITGERSTRDYLELLRNGPSESSKLLKDLLIPVTSFFRDPATFAKLTESLYPEIMKRIPANGNLRIWVAGCSTGQEAYSFAICLYELMKSAGDSRQDMESVQIFATDLSEESIAKARKGQYTDIETENLSEARLREHFTRENDTYTINKTIRDMCVFAPHDFLKDPPFSNMDIISCRNVLIYMDRDLQRKALGTFHYSLKDDGYLVLGNSESVASAAELFKDFYRPLKIYSKNRSVTDHRPMRETHKGTESNLIYRMGKGQAPASNFRKEARKLLLSRFTPAGVVIDPEMNVVHIHGSIAPYLAQPPGEPTFSLTKMALGGLSFELRNAVRTAKRENGEVMIERIPIEHEGARLLVSVRVIPLERTSGPFHLILFAPSGTGSRNEEMDARRPSGDGADTIEGLEKELIRTRENMRSVAEDMDAANEELQSANEELQSGNEEMQSLNEELETSKEELQSSNEELITVNRELVEKQRQLDSALSYSEAVIDTLREPFLVLDPDIMVQAANSAFLDKFNIVERDITGKSLFSIQEAEWDREELETLLREVLPRHKQLDDYGIMVEFPGMGKREFLINAREIFDDTTSQRLILFALEDVTERKLTEKRLSDHREGLETEVGKRNAELVISNTELKSKNDELELANERLDQFAHAATHDLQEPLRKILTFSNRIMDDGSFDLPERAGKYLKKIEDSSQRMSELVRGLLEYSRVMHYQDLFTETDLNETIEQVLSDFELLIEEKDANIEVEPLPTLEAMPMQMGQLFNNLIGNALKFSREGEAPSIIISTKKISARQSKKLGGLIQGTTYNEIIVEDNGIGFDETYGEKIFEVFGRLNSREAYSGTGIGLALVKKIMDNHNGTITATSGDGKGAAFHLILPERQSAK